MMLRTLQILIVAIWLGATALLVQRTYFPNESRYPEVPVEHVAGLFFAEEKAADLAILEDGKPLGLLMVQPRQTPRQPHLDLRGKQARELFFSGYLLPGDREAPFRKMNWGGSIYLAEGFRPVAIWVQVRMPEVDLTGQVSLELEPEPKLGYQLSQNGKVIVDSTDADKTAALLAQVETLAGGSGLDLSALREPEKIAGLIGSVQPKIDCRYGQFQIQEDRYSGHIVKLQFLEEWEVRLYISELGELLKVEGLANVTILGEAFVPQAYLLPNLEAK